MEKFRPNVRKAKIIEQTVADFITVETGLEVKVDPLKIFPGHGNIEDFFDDGDLWLPKYQEIIEVKSTTRPFYEKTFKEDWPFKNIFIVEDGPWKRRLMKDKLPIAYIIYSQPTGQMVAVSTRRYLQEWGRDLSSQSDRELAYVWFTHVDNVYPVSAFIAWLKNRT